MKFADLVEICLWPHLAVKGLNKSQCMDSSPPKKGGHCREVVVSGGSNVQEMIACSRRSDSGERCEVKRSAKKIKAREGER